MNWIDLILIVIILLCIWAGIAKGFIIGSLDLATWVGSLLAGFFFYPYLARFIESFIPLGVWTLPVAFILTIVLARLLLSILVNIILKATSRETHTNGANRFLGVIPGVINGIIWTVIVSALLLSIPISDKLASVTRDSRFASSLAMQAEWLEQKLSPVFDEAVNQSINKITINPGSEKSVTLPFKVENPKLRPDLEADMLVLVNQERVTRGLNPLEADPEMAVVARKHSKDMFARGYFSHVNPEGKTPSDRIRQEKLTFLTAGENLAYAKALKIAHKGLMNSPGHRANILNPVYGRVGIGILDGGYHGLMVTQNFRN